MPAPPVIIASADIPTANGHYAQAVRAGELLFISGQLGRGPGMTDDEAGDITTQAYRCLTRIAQILRASGSDLSRVAKTTAYIPDVALWPAVDAVYCDVFGDHRPARAVVPSGALHFDALIEIEAVAVAGAPTA